MNEQMIVILVFLAGAFGRPTVLYAREWAATREAFDWRYLVGQLLGTVAVLVPTAMSWYPEISAAGLPMAAALGWLAAEAGREVQKTIGMLRR